VAAKESVLARSSMKSDKRVNFLHPHEQSHFHNNHVSSRNLMDFGDRRITLQLVSLWVVLRTDPRPSAPLPSAFPKHTDLLKNHEWNNISLLHKSFSFLAERLTAFWQLASMPHAPADPSLGYPWCGTIAIRSPLRARQSTPSGALAPGLRRANPGWLTPNPRALLESGWKDS
jgi:hypothetical protein